MFLPDGHRILYSAIGSKTANQNGIILASLDSKESRQLLPDLSNALYVPPVAGSRLSPQDGLRESAVRKLSGVVLWSEQRARWRVLRAAASV
jgi:hypothetical protein